MWGSCSAGCGEGGISRRYRLLTRSGPASQCGGEASEARPCPGPPCPAPRPAPTTGRRLLGQFEHPLHGVAGTLWAIAPDKLLIKDFYYDGRGPDAFFWAGDSGSPGPRGATVLVHPYTGQHWDYRDGGVPVLEASSGEDITLTLPPGLNAYNVRWLSVWCRYQPLDTTAVKCSGPGTLLLCRKFAVDFGHVIVDPSEESAVETEEKPALETDPAVQTLGKQQSGVRQMTSLPMNGSIQGRARHHRPG